MAHSHTIKIKQCATEHMDTSCGLEKVFNTNKQRMLWLKLHRVTCSICKCQGVEAGDDTKSITAFRN